MVDWLDKPYIVRAVVAYCWGSRLELASGKKCKGCRKRDCGAGYEMHDKALEKYGSAEKAAPAFKVLSTASISDTGYLWDACPIWYRDQSEHRNIATLLVRWARRWQPGMGPEITALGDDVLSIVRTIDRIIMDREIEEARRRAETGGK